jgi:pimeloyl-ACP methyl ester carboxylesterase
MARTEELVYAQAEDGLPLEGAAIKPVGRDARPTAVVFVHGLTSKFYGRSMVNIGRELADRGYLFVTGNNRGHDFGYPYRPSPDAEPRIYGGGWELFDESPLDVAGWIDFAVSQGARDVVLFGHSLGALKVGYYQATRQDPRVVGLIAGSPPMMAGRIRPELLAEAERLSTQGRGRDLLPWNSMPAGAGTQSAQTYLNRARVGLDVYGKEAANPLVGRIHVPIFALFGSEEPTVGTAADLELIKRNASAARGVATRMFEGADHSYAGHEPAIAAAIADWLGSLDRVG